MKPISSAGSSRRRPQAMAACVFMILTTAGAGWLMVLTGTFWDVYVAAGMRMPAVLEVMGRERWFILIGLVALEIIIGSMAWRTRRPGLWLMIEAFGTAAFVTILAGLVLGTVLVPIQELTSALGKR